MKKEISEYNLNQLNRYKEYLLLEHNNIMIIKSFEFVKESVTKRNIFGYKLIVIEK